MISLKERFSKALDYMLYYGNGNEDKLSEYDIVIVEPAGHDNCSISRLKEKGTIVLAYLSVMEVHPSDPVSRLFMNDRLMNGDSPVENREYGTYILSMGSKSWREHLIHNAVKLCVEGNYDGIFLDTIGDVETGHIPENLRRIQFIYTVNFAEEIRQNLPERLIVQNNGIEELCMYTSQYIDGICWEGPVLNDRNRRKYNTGMIQRLNKYKDENNVKIMLLTEDLSRLEVIGEIERVCRKNGFIYYNAPNGYINIK